MKVTTLMSLTREQIAQRAGQTIPPPQQAVPIGTLLKSIAEGLEKTGGAVSAVRWPSVQAHLASALSNINADIADVAVAETVRKNVEQAEKVTKAQAEIAAALAART